MHREFRVANFGKSLCGGNRSKLSFTALIIFVCALTICSAGAAKAGTPAVSLSPTSINFGGYAVGTTSGPETVSVTNSGSAALRITSITLTGANASNFAQTNTCGSSLAAGTKCTISITFAPSASGSRTASLSIKEALFSNCKPLSLSGTGTAPAASVSPGSLTFPSQAVGATSAAQTVTVSNTGNAALSISSLALTGANPSDFAQTNNCGSSVAAGASCAISVTFKPSASGSWTASLSVADNASGSPQAVSLSGTGTGADPVASLSPTSLTFASQAVGATSAVQTITLSNTANAALSLTSIALTGTNPSDFTQTNNCGSSVAAGATCTISVTFTPSATGTRSAAVTLTDNATAGSTQSVSLSGTGTAAVAGLSPTSLTFAGQAVGATSAAQTITLRNTGTAAMSITSLALTGTNPSDFAQTNNCGSSVAAGATCTISVTFTPSASGSLTASLSIADNASGSPQAVSLSGTGTAPAAGVSPSSLTFASQAVGATSAAQTVTLNNTGTAAMSITSLALTGTNPSDFAQTNNCGSSVAAGASCTISVTFTPSASGSWTASLSIADNASGSPQAVSLSGTGTAPAAPISASFVQAVASASSASPSSMSLSFPVNTLVGDLLLVAFDYASNVTPSSVTDSQGNVFTPVGNQLSTPGGALSQVYYAQNIKGGADTVTVTLTATSSYLEVYLSEYAGINPTNPIDAQAGASGTAGAVSSGNATTTAAGDIIYGFCVGDWACTPGSGFAARSTLDDNVIESEVASTAGSYAATGSATNGWTMQMVALKPASVVAPPGITSATTANGTVGASFSYQITATNTPTTYGAAVLPAGLSVNSATGLISGTPTSAGTSTVTLSASNAAGTGNATLTLTFAATLPASFVQAVASAALGAPSSLSLPFPANTLAGDLLLVAFDYSSNVTPSSVSDSQGNVFTPVGNQLSTPGGALSQVYYAQNIKGGADTVTVTLTAASSYLEVYLSEYAGINPTNPIDAQAGASGAAGTASSGNASTTVAGDIIYGFCVGDGACTAGSGFTARSTLNSNLTEDMLAGSAGSYAATGSATKGWSMQMVALKSASGSTTVTTPAASLSPASLTFANQAVGTSSAAQSVTLNNTGNAALSITSIAITGTNPSDFAQTNNCGASVAAGANCTISVTFTPAASGSFTAALTLTDNATGSPQSVTFSGTGTGNPGGTGTPTAVVSPSSLTFGSEPAQSTSAAQTITVSNTGTAAMSITSIALAGTNPSDFAQTNNCGSSVAAGANCTISVTFTPSASGSWAASLSIADNASGSPQAVSLSGTGTGTTGPASLSTTSLAFSSQPVDVTSTSQSVTLTNTGTTTLSITSLAFTGTNASDFVENNNCGSSVAAGANCTIVVSFTPAASGSRTAALAISDSATGSPQTVSLSGTGSHDVILSWTDSPTSGVIGYNVYRGTTSGGESSTPLNSTPISGAAYTDESVTAGATYYYLVTAVSSNDVTQSAASNEIAASVPSP